MKTWSFGNEWEGTGGATRAGESRHAYNVTVAINLGTPVMSVVSFLGFLWHFYLDI